MIIEDEIKKLVNILEDELKLVLRDKTGYQSIIFESIDYSLFTGGKRLRPILLLKSFELFNKDYKYAIPFALAIEMIHTYSLIHDDLPAMDDDDFRRGKASNHKVYGEAMAILAGDGLLNLAFETMLQHILEKVNTREEYIKNIKAMKEIANYSGIYGMIGGQVLDLIANDVGMDEEKLLFMYKNKTAALIQAALVSGAILGGATNMEIENIREFGFNLGLAYQIKDDILDIEEDRQSGKLTYATYLGLDSAKEEVKKFSKKALELLEDFENKDTEFLKKLTELLIYRSY